MSKVKNVEVQVQSKEVKAAKMAAILEKQAIEQKEAADKKAAKKAKSSKPGIIKTIGMLIMEAGKEPINREQILDELEERFGTEVKEDGELKHSRETMSKTVTAQLGRKRPMRFERENDVVFDVELDTDGNRTFGYSVE